MRIKRNRVMATPIKETPIIKGNDAKVFISKMVSVNQGKTLDEKMRQSMRDNFNKINSIVK